jgi:hypothetical protein
MESNPQRISNKVCKALEDLPSVFGWHHIAMNVPPQKKEEEYCMYFLRV